MIKQLTKKDKKLLIFQLVLVFFIALIYKLTNDVTIHLLSAVIGGFVAFGSSVLLLFSKVLAHKSQNIKQGMIFAYLFAGLRFFLVGGLLALGAILGLKIIHMVIGFVVVQIGQFISLIKR